MISLALQVEGYQTIFHTSPLTALNDLNVNSYAMVMSGRRIGDTSGEKILNRVKEVSPNSVRVLLADCSPNDQSVIKLLTSNIANRLVFLPVDPDELLTIVRQSVDEYYVNVEKAYGALLDSSRRQAVRLKEVEYRLDKLTDDRSDKLDRLTEQLRASFLGSIDVLATLVDRVADSKINRRTHIHRVVELTRRVVTRLGVDAVESLDISVAARLFDIGKTSLPGSLLRKPRGEITKRERDMLRRHVLYGEALVSKVPNLQNTAKIIRHQYEKYNGNGYPDRLKANRIPRGARVLAVVNAYLQQMGESTDYEHSRRAVERIFQSAGDLYDPTIVDELPAAVRSLAIQPYRSKEVQIPIGNLRNGMVLARNVIAPTWIMLHGTELNEEQIERFKQLRSSDPDPDDNIWVYKESTQVKQEEN